VLSISQQSRLSECYHACAFVEYKAYLSTWKWIIRCFYQQRLCM